jgi:hypothetical protein
LRRNVYKATAGGKVEPKFFTVGFHDDFSQKNSFMKEFYFILIHSENLIQ